MIFCTTLKMQRLSRLQANDVTAGSSGLSWYFVRWALSTRREEKVVRICRPHLRAKVGVHCDPYVHHRREKYSNVTPTYTLPSLIICLSIGLLGNRCWYMVIPFSQMLFYILQYEKSHRTLENCFCFKDTLHFGPLGAGNSFAERDNVTDCATSI